MLQNLSQNTVKTHKSDFMTVKNIINIFPKKKNNE